MSIVKYVPPIKNIVDRRSSERGYYVAICECCGTEFYPARNSARYCNPNCQSIKYREAHLSAKKTNVAEVAPNKSTHVEANQQTSTPVEVAPVMPKKYDCILNSRGEVIEQIKFAEVRTHGLLKLLKNLSVGESLTWAGFDITRLSMYRYGMSFIGENE